jgi:hypothetical protein
MGFTKKEYEFLVKIGLGPENLGGYINGAWRATRLVVSSVNPRLVVSSMNPSNNQVFWFWLNFFFFHCLMGWIFFCLSIDLVLVFVKPDPPRKTRTYSTCPAIPEPAWVLLILLG